MSVLLAESVDLFHKQFGTKAVPRVYRAPGRVNLIGEHTDYNLGYVFPIALQLACYAAVAKADHGQLRVYSHDLAAEFAIDVREIEDAEPRHQWHDYVVGVARELIRAGYEIEPCDLWISSAVPAGSGLSSSAALEIATAMALLDGRRTEPLDLALLAQRAESQFVGMPCGIMDQYASVFGHAGTAIQIDCRSLTHEYVPIPPDLTILAVNSMVKHELGTSAYRERVAECLEAVAAIQGLEPEIQSLRDVSLQLFDNVQESIPLVARHRARHIVSETQRVLDFAAAARKRDLYEMGRLFIASHRSMQYDYEITCEEIDFLVDHAIKLPGVYGARMTGGGFGGCTVNLIAPEALNNFCEQLNRAYRDRFGITPAFYDCEPADGAGPA